MNDFEFLTLEDMKNFSQLAAEMGIQSYFESENPRLDFLINLCETLNQMIVKVKLSSDFELLENQIYEYAGKALFNIRTYFTKEEIIFRINYISDDGLLSELDIPQERLLAIAKVKGDALRYCLSLDTSLKKKEVKGKAQANWLKIYKWATVEKQDNNLEDTEIEGIYRKLYADKNVFVKYAGNARQRHYYYGGQPIILPNGHRTVSNSVYYNEGWLAEWYQALMAEHGRALTQLSADYFNDINYPLNNFMAENKMDRVEGIKGGDVYFGRKAFQIKKMNNDKIISFIQIESNIKKLEEILKAYKMSGIKTTLKTELQKIFSEQPETEQARKKLNQSYSSRIMEQIKILDSNLK